VSELVLVAADGGRTGANALRFAAAYAAARGATIEIISVVEPLSDLPVKLPHRMELECAHARGVGERVRDHLRDVVGPHDWPLHLRLGRPAPAICETASARGADMLVLGVDARKEGEDGIAMEVLHLAETPVLVVRDGRLPRTGLVAVDFRPSSFRAARAACRLVGPGGVLHLVHVEPVLDFPAASVWDWSGRYHDAVHAGFQQMARELSELGACEIHTHTRTGDPSPELVQAADDLGADLLAMGSDGYISNGRVVVGRTARRLLAESVLPILATPVVTMSAGSIVDLAPQSVAGPLPLAGVPSAD
jgi:nucleotide-binding universal stress UspA family protein